jgi:predicted ATP-dependent endonuclease of OLD family
LKIERLLVEGGFLDGLDMPFTAGMNVLIGGRGTGKTSVIELLRFCLDSHSYTEDSAARSREHALAVLQDGQVTLTIKEGANRFSLSRTADSMDSPHSNFVTPIVFSQTDIESLGLQATGRLRLIAPDWVI